MDKNFVSNSINSLSNAERNKISSGRINQRGRNQSQRSHKYHTDRPMKDPNGTLNSNSMK
jgi:hypothetical protein